MNLAQLIQNVRRKSGYSASRESAITAINEAARRIYNWIVKETPGHYFMKWDLTLTLAKGTQEYLLQPDLEQIVRIRELDPGTGQWRIVHSTDFDDISRIQGALGVVPSFLPSESSTDSVFRYYGPYEKDDGNFYIRIEPDIDQNRSLEVVYTAHFVEVTAEADYFMIPEDGRGIVQDFATAEVLQDIDDDLGDKVEQRGSRKLTEYLTLIRAKQIGDTPPKQEQYLDC